ncbi:MAG TPA: GGDEF domain-containing protein [Actinomycetota bacterium]
MKDGATGSSRKDAAPARAGPAPRDLPAAGSGRLAVFAMVRASIPVFALIGLAAAPSTDLDVRRIAALLTAQVAMAAATQALVIRRRSAAAAIVWLGIVADLVVITALAASTGGASGPLTFLYTIEAVAAGILLESRVGMRVLGMSMAAIIGLDIAASRGLIVGEAGGLQALMAVAVLWTTAGGAIAFSMFNEREIRRHTAQLQTIRRITLDIEDSLSIPEIMADLCRGVVDEFNFSSAAVLVRSGDALAVAGGHNVTGSSSQTIPLRGPLSEAIGSGRASIVPAARARTESSLSDLFGARGYVAVPLGDEGLLVATRTGRGRRGALIRDREVEALEGLAHHAALALANAALHEHVSAMARTDPLTGLPNHGEFQRALAAELGRLERFATLRGGPHHVSLLLLDIDHFKSFNDTYGHQAGDDVLRGVSDAVRGAVRTFDVPARYGGEELAVVLPETDPESAALVAERVRKAIADWTGGPRQVTVSVGVATAPANGTTPAEMVASADAALYAGKQSGRNQVSIAKPGRAPRAVVQMTDAKSRRTRRAEPRADGESPPAHAQSSRPKRRTPRG